MDYKFPEIVVAAGLFYFAFSTVDTSATSTPLSDRRDTIAVSKPAFVPVDAAFVPVPSKGNDKATCLRRAIENSYNIRERGFNRGREVEEIQAFTGNRPPDPYCASGVCKLSNDCGIANPKSAWSPTVATYGRLVYRRTSTSLSDRRDASYVSMTNRYPEKISNPLVMAIYTQSKGRVTHVGFALKTDGKMTRTGEFNTSGSKKSYGISDGDGFHFLYRPNEQIYSLRDWIN